MFGRVGGWGKVREEGGVFTYGGYNKGIGFSVGSNRLTYRCYRSLFSPCTCRSGASSTRIRGSFSTAVFAYPRYKKRVLDASSATTNFYDFYNTSAILCDHVRGRRGPTCVVPFTGDGSSYGRTCVDLVGGTVFTPGRLGSPGFVSKFENVCVPC